MTKYINCVIIGASALFAFCVCNQVSATELDKMYLELEKAIMTNRHYELNDPFQRKKSLNLGFNIKLSELWYWNNRIESTIGPSKFEQVAWRFELGAKIIPELTVYYGHYSSHTLDGVNFRTLESNKLRYPELNSLGLRWNLK